MSDAPIRRIAVSRLHFADGHVERNQVLELQAGRVVRHYPLEREIPFCEWHGGDYTLGPDDAPQTAAILSKNFTE